MEFVSHLEIQDRAIYPLPGGVIKRGSSLVVDPRLKVADIKSTDTFVIYEHIATVLHRPTKRQYVAFRETKPAQYIRQQDPVKYPVWLMESAGKDRERALYIHLVTTLPSTLRLGIEPTTWVDRWLRDLDSRQEYESLAYFLINQGVVAETFEASHGKETGSR